MARCAAKEAGVQAFVRAGCRLAEVDAAVGAERAIARERSARSVEQNCRRIYSRAFGAGCFAGGDSLRASAPARVALRTRADFQDRHLAKAETALRRKDRS